MNEPTPAAEPKFDELPSKSMCRKLLREAFGSTARFQNLGPGKLGIFYRLQGNEIPVASAEAREVIADDRGLAWAATRAAFFALGYDLEYPARGRFEWKAREAPKVEPVPEPAPPIREVDENTHEQGCDAFEGDPCNGADCEACTSSSCPHKPKGPCLGCGTPEPGTNGDCPRCRDFGTSAGNPEA